MTAHLRVTADGFVYAGRERIGRCALGTGGIVAAADKCEGDGATPAGIWPLRQALYRPDREAPALTRLPLAPLAPEDGWCNGPGPLYNRAVSLPCPYRCERMWRDDHCYDLIVVLGHNDAPVVADRGSAIFVHLARDGYAPTEGCVGLARDDMLHLLLLARPDAMMEIALG